jgi:hypothetical protein
MTDFQFIHSLFCLLLVTVSLQVPTPCYLVADIVHSVPNHVIIIRGEV